ncbi:MAG TPA: peptidylprolyl isomerase [Bryobacteraceae bacterium]|nr:peptidylprolyl isomerase [Bryobacteraceae bacterium]
MRLTVGVILCAAIALAQTPPAAPAVDLPDEPGLYAVFDTSMGVIVTKLFEDKTPNTVKNFVALAEGTKATLNTSGQMVKKHYYDGLTFHRVIKGFMIQTGDIRGTGTSVCGIPNIKDEIDPELKFDVVGRLAMANTGKPNTSACQIFITVGRTHEIDGQYTIFGQVVSGQDVAVKISSVPVTNEKPVLPVRLKTVTIRRKE